MSNFKLVKTAAALALGASVVTSAVATTDASAASKYKIKSGKLVYAKSGKVVKGYVTYKSTVYKNGSKLTGLKGKTYYKAGKKATGTYKGAYYVKGVKKVTTGTYNKAYYVKGVKKVSTGLYASKYYKDGKLATGTYKGAYYVKGLKKVTTGTYNGAYYVKGKKVVSTGLYADKLYVDGKLNKGYKLYNEDLYKDAVLNTELALFEGKLYDGAKLNEGHKIFKDELYNGSELNKDVVLFEGKLYDGAKLNEGIKKFEDKWYNNAELADGTFTDEGVEKAFENGVEVGAKVKSVEAINAKQIKVTFNKSVDATTVAAANTKALKNITVTKVGQAASNGLTAVVSEDKKSVTITAGNSEVFNGSYAVDVTENVKAATGDKFAAYSQLLQVSDKVAPSFLSASAVAKSSTKEVTVKFDEPVKADGVIAYVNGTAATVKAGENANELIVVSSTDLTAGSSVSIKLTNVQDYNNNYTASNPLEFNVTVVADTVAPAIVSADVDGENKVKVTFDKELDATQVLTTKARLAAVNGSSSATPTDVEFDGKTVTFTFAPSYDAKTGLASGIFFLDAGVKDKLGNESTTSFNKQVSFSKDTVKPTVTSVEYKDNAIVAKFSEKVSLVGSTVTAINKATGKVTNITLTSDNAKLSDDKQTLTITDGLAEGTYELRLPAGLVNDEAGVPNASEYYTTTITVKATAVTPEADTTKPVVEFSETNGALTVDKSADTKEYLFSYNLSDNVAINFASVLNTSNYTYNGKALPTGSYVTTNADDEKDSAVTVTIHVPKTSVASTVTAGTFSVVGVKDAAGNSINGVQSSKVTLVDGVAPTLASASLANNTLVLGYSEDVAAATPADLEVKVNGKVLTLAEDEAFTPGSGSDQGKYLLDLSDYITEGAAATATLSDNSGATVTGTYTGTTDATVTFTYTDTAWNTTTSGVVIANGKATYKGVTVTLPEVSADATFNLELTATTPSYIEIEGAGFDASKDIKLSDGTLPAGFSLAKSNVITSVTVSTKSTDGDLTTTDTSDNANKLVKGTTVTAK